MAGLSFNPDGHHIRNGRTLAEIIADEEYLDSEEPVQEEKKEEKKMKFMSFELDMTYPRTIKGFVRILQILLLLVAFICLIITSMAPNQAVYSFYCVFLVIGAVISGFLFFTVLAGTRKKGICGMPWVKVELIYFILFGFIIFIGACLAASNSDGNPALNASAAFGFIASITFAVYIFWTWREYKNPPEDPDKEDKDEEEAGEKSDIESQNGDNKSNKGAPNFANSNRNSMEKRNVSTIDPPENVAGDLRIDVPERARPNEGKFGQPPDYRSLNQRTRSLERPLSIISRNELIDPPARKNHQRPSKYRRRLSGSDSAYSEGSIVDRDRSLPSKIRRTASARAGDRRRNFEQTRRQTFEEKRNDRQTQELSAEMLSRVDSRPRKSVPNWLRAALDCENDNDVVGKRLVSTMPARRNEFPLLHMSDEESIAYPSVSQNCGNGDFGLAWSKDQGHAAARGERGRRHHGHRGRRDVAHGHHRQHRHQIAHGGQMRGGKRFHNNGHRHHAHAKRQFHGQNRGYGRRGARHGNMMHGNRGSGHRMRQADDDFLRKMVENDQLVNHGERGNG